MKVKSLLLSLMCIASAGAYAQTLNWYTMWGSNTAGSQIEPVRMVVDSDGDLYAASMFGGNAVVIADETVTSKSGTDKGDAVITKLTPAKELVWNRPLTGSGKATVSDLVLDSQNNVVATGTFSGTLEPEAGHSMQMEDPSGYMQIAAYVVRFDKNGSLLNMWHLPSEEMTVGNITVDADDNIVIAGTFGSEMSFDPAGLDHMVGSTQYFNQLFVAKYTPAGDLLWVKYTQDESASYTNAFVKADKDGSLYVAGTFTGNASFAGTALTTAAGANDVLLVKYTASGNEVWAKRMGGTRGDKAVDLAVSDFGDVAVCCNYYSEDITVTGVDDILNNGYAKEGEADQYHIGIFTFGKETGTYRWWYSWGYNSTVGGGGGEAYVLRCTDEGVYYIGANCSGRYGDLYTHEHFATANYGLKLIDGTWVQHNTNGGADALYLVLNREGQLCSIGRAGGPQTERLKDIALSPDKKSVYFLYNMCVRNNEIYTCIDNLWDSYTDIKAFGRQSRYNLIQVLCPENPVDNKYSEAYKNVFNSAVLARYDLPAITPDRLPDYTSGTPYSQTLTHSATGKGVFYPFFVPDEMNFDENNTLGGTINDAEGREFGVILTDSVGLPGEITYYAQDPDHISIRGNSRNVRYMSLEEISGSGIEETSGEPDGVFFPTLCTRVLNVKTDETDYTVEIYNHLGMRMLSVRNMPVIAVNSLTPGIYYARLQTPAGIKNTAKFIIK